MDFVEGYFLKISWQVVAKDKDMEKISRQVVVKDK